MVNINELIKELSNPDEEVRAEAARAIKSAGFEKLPEDQRLRTKIRICTILRAPASFDEVVEEGENALPILKEFMRDKDLEISGFCFGVAVEFAKKGIDITPVVPVLEDLVDSEANEWNNANGTATRALTIYYKDNKMWDKLEKLIMNEKPHIGDEAVYRLDAGLITDKSIPEEKRIRIGLRIALSPSEGGLFPQVEEAISQVGNRIVPILKELLKEKDNKTYLIKANIIKAIMHTWTKGIDITPMIDDLTELLANENPGIRDPAMDAFYTFARNNVDISHAVSILEEMINTEDGSPFIPLYRASKIVAYHYAINEDWEKIKELPHDNALVRSGMFEAILDSGEGIDTVFSPSEMLCFLDSTDENVKEPVKKLIARMDKKEVSDSLKEMIMRETGDTVDSIVFENFYYDGVIVAIIPAFPAISQFFSKYAKGCEKGEAPVLNEEGAESAAKLLIMGQVVYWALTERSFVFDHIREGKMDRIVAEDAIEKNLPEGWIKHMRKYVKALYEGAKDDKEREFLRKFAELEGITRDLGNFKEAGKVWDLFYVNNCLSKEDRRKYQEFIKGKRTGTKSRIARVMNG